MELMVTVGIMAVLTSLLILYGRTSEKRIILFRDQAKVVSVIMRAKSLAIQTFVEEGAACGYGVQFDALDNRRFFIFKDSIYPGDNCGGSDQVYTEGRDEIFEEGRLDSNLKFSVQGGRGVLFIPPDPRVRIYPGPFLPTRFLLITISDLAGSVGVKIKTNAAGQITTQ